MQKICNLNNNTIFLCKSWKHIVTFNNGRS